MRNLRFARLSKGGFGQRVAHVRDGAEALGLCGFDRHFCAVAPASIPKLIPAGSGVAKMSGLHVLRQLKSD